MAEMEARLDEPISEEDPETTVLGMWVFLASEVMFFGGLFLGYIVYRQAYPDIFAEGSRHLNLAIGAINTFLLLTSSFTVALAVNSAQLRRRKAIIGFLALTLLLGFAFLGLKAFEWYLEIQENLYPGGNFQFTGPGYLPAARIFFSLYFAMTGLHAVHMIVGLILIGTLILMTWLRKTPPQKIHSIELVGLYWHFVDIVWIFLFPLLYLIDRT